MSEVERFKPYSFLANGLASVQMVPEPEGEYVRFTDYLAVRAKLEIAQRLVADSMSGRSWQSRLPLREGGGPR